MKTWQDRYLAADRSNLRREKLKQQCVDHMGGRCTLCGYNACLDALQFHHVDPAHKDFTISAARSFSDELKLELDKCVLLCANCHAEQHRRLRTIQRLDMAAVLELEDGM
jgi:5-methylcytosine-specific restriction endonuclease McrA